MYGSSSLVDWLFQLRTSHATVVSIGWCGHVCFPAQHSANQECLELTVSLSVAFCTTGTSSKSSTLHLLRVLSLGEAGGVVDSIHALVITLITDWD